MGKRNKNPQYRVKHHNYLIETMVFARADRKENMYNWWMSMQTAWAALLHQSRGFKGYMYGNDRFHRTFTPLGKRKHY